MKLKHTTAAVLTALTLNLASALPLQAAEQARPLSSGVNRVNFASEGERLAGLLYLPEGYTPGTKLPAVIIQGPWTQVKEQVGVRYAQEFAKRGFAALAFDNRYWGESTGTPRNWEHPQAKIQDLRNAVTFLRSLPEVDPAQINGVGVCFGAGYMAELGSDERLNSFALVASWLHDAETVPGAFGGAERVATLVAQADEAMAAFKANGEVRHVPAFSETEPFAGMGAGAKPYYGDASRGAVPAWENRLAQLTWREYFAFDGISPGAKVKVPALIVHSDGSALPNNVRRFFQLIPGEKELHWTTGMHLDFYDRDAEVQPTMDRIAEFFRKHGQAAPYIPDSASRNDGKQTINEFLDALEAMDIERFLKVWAEDGRQIMPYSPDGFSRELNGKAAVRQQYGSLPVNFNFMRFRERQIHATDEPGVFWATYRGEIEIKATGGSYNNIYAGRYVVRDGKVQEFTEYFNPITMLTAFGDPQALQKNFNVK